VVQVIDPYEETFLKAYPTIFGEEVRQACAVMHVSCVSCVGVLCACGARETRPGQTGGGGPMRVLGRS
jgi:hypothetical protein